MQPPHLPGPASIAPQGAGDSQAIHIREGKAKSREVLKRPCLDAGLSAWRVASCLDTPPWDEASYLTFRLNIRSGHHAPRLKPDFCGVLLGKRSPASPVWRKTLHWDPGDPDGWPRGEELAFAPHDLGWSPRSTSYQLCGLG